MEYEKKFYTKWWFWLFVISVIVLIIFAIVYETHDKGIFTPWWIWAIAVIGLILFIIAIFLYLNDVLAYKKLRECLKTPEIEEIKDKPILFEQVTIKKPKTKLTNN